MVAKVTWGHGVLNAMLGPEPQGGIFWLGDEYAPKNDYTDDIDTLILNVIAQLCGPGNKRVCYSASSTWAGFLRDAITGAGHSIAQLTVATNLTVANYDLAMLDNSLCTQAQIWAFVQSGGSVVIPLGTYNETIYWGDLFGYTGVGVVPATYVFGGLVNTTANSASPYFAGVSSVYMNGASVLTAGAPSAGGTVTLFSGTVGASTYNVFAVWVPA